jgi:hypothetical protein
VLRRLFGLKKNEITGGWKQLYNKELHNLHSSPNIIRVIKSMKMRWEGRVASVGEKRDLFRVLVVSQKERDH